MWTIKNKSRFVTRSYHMDVGGLMIGWIDDRTKAIEAENSRHNSANLSA
jgi:hypothetical protein